MPVTKVYKVSHDFYVLFFLLSEMCVPTLWVCFTLFFSTSDERSWIPIRGQHSRHFLTVVNEGIYWSFIRFSWHFHGLGDAMFWAGVGWRRPLLSLSKHSCPILKPLGATLTPAHLCLFSNSRWQKQRPYANWQWQVSTWTTAERKTNATSA